GVTASRGVDDDGVMRTLDLRGFIAEGGKDPGPGQAVLFGTTPLFLERLGLNGLDQLPPLGEFVPGADVVEHLESGLRPTPGPTLSERLDEIEAANAVRGDAAEPVEIRLDEIHLDDLDDDDEEQVSVPHEGDGVRLQKVLAHAGL